MFIPQRFLKTQPVIIIAYCHPCWAKENCEIRDYQTNDINERRLYIVAMELYCDLISGRVLQYNYLKPQMRKSFVASVFKTGIPNYQVEEKVCDTYIKDVKSQKLKKEVGKVKYH